jgi:hypothetical protein
MLGVLPVSLLKPVEELIEAGIVRERGEQLSFQHDLIREAVRHSSGPSARRALDRQAADVMLAAGALPVEVAIQLADSAAQGDDVAIATLLKAAESLATTDRGQRGSQPTCSAASAERHSLRGRSSFKPRCRSAAGRIMRRDLRRRRARTSSGRGGGEGASRHCRDVARLCRCAGARQPRGAKLSGLPAGARRAPGQVGLQPPGRRTHRRSADCLVGSGSRRRSPRPGCRFPLALSEGGLDYVRGRFARSLAQFETILRDGVADADRLDELLTRLWRTAALFALDRADDALDAADAIIADALKRGFATSSTSAR